MTSFSSLFGSSSTTTTTTTTTTSAIDYDVNDKLNKVEKDIDDVISKILLFDQQIDKIEIYFLNENAVLGESYLLHLKKREETLRSQKAEYRYDLDALRSKERQLLEFKLTKQFSILNKDSLDVMKSRTLSESFKDKLEIYQYGKSNKPEPSNSPSNIDDRRASNESTASTKSNSKLTNEFHKILNTLPDTKGFDFANEKPNVKPNVPVTSTEEEKPNGVLVRRFAETGLKKNASIIDDIFDVNTGIDIYDGFYVI